MMKPELVRDSESEKKKPERVQKPRLETIQPFEAPKQIVDVLKLFERSVKEQPWEYPSLDEENIQELASHVYQFISSPGAMGMILKIGRRPVGMIIGQVNVRPFGKPRQYAFIWTAWIEPEFRKKGFMKTLFGQYMSWLKEQGIHHWEANADDSLSKLLTEYHGFKISKLYQRIGGKTGG